MPSADQSNPDLVDETVEEITRTRPDINPDAVEVVCRLIFSGRKMETFAAETMKPIGMNYTDLDVLGSLLCAKDGLELTPAQLMRAAMITSGAMSICLDRLEKNGLINRRKDDIDKRVRRISITDKGRAKINEAFTLRFGAAEDLIANLSPTEIKDLNSTLRRIIRKSDELI